MGEGLRQWPEDREAPRPVSARTCWALKASRSFAACLLRSVIEKNQIPKNAIDIEILDLIAQIRHQTQEKVVGFSNNLIKKF